MMRVERWSEAAAPDEETLRQRLVAEGYSVIRWSDPPGATYPPHTHPTDQSHRVLSGTLLQTYAALAPSEREGSSVVDALAWGAQRWDEKGA